MCPLIHGLVQGDVWLHRVHWPADAPSLTAGQTRNDALQVDLQRRTKKLPAKKMARRWGDVTLHPTMSDAIRARTCT
jgi:hypothetical protein